MNNFLNWVTDTDTITDWARNRNYPIYNLRPMVAKTGDFWRLLVDASHLRREKPENVTVKILKQNTPCNVWNGTWSDDQEKRGKLRRQWSERYTEFSVQIADVSTEAKPKQFALVRSNGQTLLNTVYLTATNATDYARKIKALWEAYPYACVHVWQNGTVLTVRVYHNANFMFRDEIVSIGAGIQSENNTNTPSLSVVVTSGVTTLPARYRWKVNISNVEEGNIFRLNGNTYVAKSGDTAQTVLDMLNSGSSTLTLPTTTIPTIAVEVGGRNIVNSNSPTIRLSYVDTSGGNDRYNVIIGEDIDSGNIYEIVASGEPTKRTTATASSTTASIKAALVEISGYYEVATGTTPTERAILGSVNIANSNDPTFFLSNREDIASEDVITYAVVVGSDVQAGNIFYYQDDSYVAQVGDTAQTVATALGLDAVSTLVTSASAPVGYAVKGKKTFETADVRLIQQPVVKVASQYVLEVDFRGLSQGSYNIKIEGENGLAIYSNTIVVDNYARYTAMLEVASSGNVFDYQYMESGLTQRIRLPIEVLEAKTRVSENKTKKLDGGYERAVTAIEKTRQLQTQAEFEEFHDVLSQWLKHDKVWVNEIDCYVEGSYVETQRPSWEKRWSANAILVENKEKNNRGRFVVSGYIPAAYGRVVLSNFWYGIEIILKRGELEHVISSEKANIPAGEWELIIRNDGDTRTVRVALEGFLDEDVARIPARSVARWRRWVRVESGKTTEIVFERLLDDLGIDYQPEYEQSAVVVTSYDKVLEVGTDANEFSTEFSSEFTS